MTFKPIIIFLCCVIICGESYAKHKKASDNVLYIVDYIPQIAPNEYNFRLAGEFYISNNDIFSKEIISDKKKIISVGYKDIDTLIVIITNQYHNRPDKIKQIPSFYNIALNGNNERLYLKYDNKPYSGDFINYYFFGKMFCKGKIYNGLLTDTFTSYYEDGITTKVSTNMIKGRLDGPCSAYFVNGRLKFTGSYTHNIKTGYWIEWYSTGIMKRRLFYDNGKLITAKEDQKWTDMLEKARKYKEAKNYDLALVCLAAAVEAGPDVADIYYLKGNMELQMKHYHDAIVDLNKAIKLEPLYTEAIADRILARIERLEAPGSRRILRLENDTTPEEEKGKICDDLNVIYLCQKMDRYISLNIRTYTSARATVENLIKKYCQ